MIQSHRCPRCKCLGMIINWGQTSCILCGYNSDTNTTGNDDTDDPDILRDLYPTRAPLLFVNRQNTLKQLNFGVGNPLRR
jgi:hypothetical protein